MTAVHERNLRVVVQGAAAHRNVEDQRHVLNNVQALTEAGAHDSVLTPTQGREVEPRTAQQGGSQLLTLQNSLTLGTVERLSLLHQSVRQAVVLINHDHAGKWTPQGA